MPRALILHCGPPKTGTSALQAHLTSNAPQGLLYPETGRWPDGAHHLLTFALDGVTQRGDIVIPPVQELSAPLMQEINTHHGDVILSSEHLSHDQLPRLIDWLDDNGARFDRVRALVALRHPLERVASAYNQGVKDAVLAERRFPDAYLRAVGHGFKLMPFVQTWRSGQIEPEFINYHPAEDFVLRIMGQIGHEIEGEMNKRKNASINGFGIVALLAAHRLEFDPDQRAAFFASLRRNKRNRIWGGSSFPFSRRAAREYLDSIKEDLGDLHCETGINMVDLHPEPPKRFRLKPDQLDAIRDEICQFDLTTKQQKTLDRVLSHWQRPRRLDDAQTQV